MIQIDKGVPIPAHCWAGNPGNNHEPTTKLYPFDDLEVGDSFFVPFPPGCRQRRRFLHSNIDFAKRRTGFAFTRRTLEEGGVWGLRIWRVS